MPDQTPPASPEPVAPPFDPAAPHERAAEPYRAPKKSGSARTVAIAQNGWLYTATGLPIAEGKIPKSKLSRSIGLEPDDADPETPDAT